jgi:hypothetical protein
LCIIFKGASKTSCTIADSPKSMHNCECAKVQENLRTLLQPWTMTEEPCIGQCYMQDV